MDVEVQEREKSAVTLAFQAWGPATATVLWMKWGIQEEEILLRLGNGVQCYISHVESERRMQYPNVVSSRYP